VVGPSLIPSRPGDRIKTDRRHAHYLRHSPSGPMRGLPWRLSTGQCQSLGNDGCGERRCAGRACLVAQQPFHALCRKAGLPTPNCWSTDTGPPRHLLHGQPLGRGQNDPGALDVL
jgi:hypothetical protein